MDEKKDDNQQGEIEKENIPSHKHSKNNKRKTLGSSSSNNKKVEEKSEKASSIEVNVILRESEHDLTKNSNNLVQETSTNNQGGYREVENENHQEGERE